MEITINYYGQAVSVSVEVYEYLTQADHKTENLAHEQRRHYVSILNPKNGPLTAHKSGGEHDC